jgi:hypothetical protein
VNLWNVLNGFIQIIAGRNVPQMSNEDMSTQTWPELSHRYSSRSGLVSCFHWCFSASKSCIFECLSLDCILSSTQTLLDFRHVGLELNLWKDCSNLQDIFNMFRCLAHLMSVHILV